MSIRILREQGFKGLTMRYEDGGQVEVYEMDGKQVRVEADAREDDVLAALNETFKEGK